MAAKNVPYDEWVELVPETLEDDYSIVVRTAPIYLAVGDRPSQPVEGLPISDGATYSGEVDRGDAIYARAQNDVDASVRVVPGIRIEGSNEVSASVGEVQSSSGTNVSPASDDFVHEQGTGVDLSSGDKNIDFQAPDRADFVVIHLEPDGSNSCEAQVKFADTDLISGSGSVVTSRVASDNGDLKTSDGSDVFVRVAIASPYVRVTLTGTDTGTDYSIYAR